MWAKSEVCLVHGRNFIKCTLLDPVIFMSVKRLFLSTVACVQLIVLYYIYIYIYIYIYMQTHVYPSIYSSLHPSIKSV